MFLPPAGVSQKLDQGLDYERSVKIKNQKLASEYQNRTSFRIMKIQQLRALIETAETGSIHGASRRLHLTQPAVTRAIRELENECGVQLLERHPWGMAPTAEGMTLLQRARNVVRELERAEEDLGHLRGKREGRLVVGVTPLAGMAGLVEAFVEFRRHWPRVTVEFRELEFNQLTERLGNRTIDIALAAFPVNRGEAPGIVRALFAFDSVLVTRADGKYASAKDLADLQDAEWIHTDVTDSYPEFVRGMFQDAGLAPPERITLCTSYSLFYALALKSDAVLALNLLALNETVVGRSFVELSIEPAPPPSQLFLLSPPDAQLTKPAEHLIDCILKISEVRAERLRVAAKGADCAE
ncbi:LysR family transcriptional regulator [Paraburkholderia guartelaensis]|uniref:LysR family transcriptional regulator n=1 Tax=Paraburkholderia guartelaensis TaxID=2546446 RepID=UPI002AB7BA0E|nr:LysR family transcriptional regulator [Paraburkholderia guartelaensis]